jgi:Mg2+ and Co2+ transporter CorA
VAGQIDPAEPSDVERQLASQSFLWLDLESPDTDRLGAFGQSLRLSDETLQTLARVSQRPSAARVGDTIQAVVPGVNPGRSARDIRGIRVVFTDRFLLTTHSEPSPAVDTIYRRYDHLQDDKKTDGPTVLFLVLDEIVDTFEPALLQLDSHLDEIQVALLRGTPAGVQDDLINARRALSEVVQALGWYDRDLHHLVGNVGQLPGMNPAAAPLFDQHRKLVTTLRDAARDYRDETQDALGQVADNSASRQGQLINLLTVIATIFLPLTFITGYFGMNFGVITMQLNRFWVFAVLGLALPAASVIVTVVLFQRLAARLHVVSLLPPQGASRTPVEHED